MFKRLIALIGALAMIFVLALPCFATTTYDTTDDLVLFFDDVGSQKIVFLVYGTVNVSFSNSEDSVSTVANEYSAILFNTYDGILYGYYLNGSSWNKFFRANSSGFNYIKSTFDTTIYDSFSISYNSADVLYAHSDCVFFGFSYVSDGATQDDVVNAYNEGYIAGQESIDQDAIRQEGYDDGYIAGEESTDAYRNGFTDGAASIDQAFIRQEGYDAGYDEGYDIGYVDGQESIDQEAIHQEGYSAGYSDAIDDLDGYSVSLFEYCTFTAVVTGSYPDSGKSYSHSISFTPNFIYSGITFDSLYDQVQTFLTDTVSDPDWEYIDRVVIQMVWEDEYVFDYRTLPLYITGDYDVNYGQLYSTSGTSYSLNADDGYSNLKRQFEVDSDVTSILTEQVDIWVGRPADLLKAFTIYAPTESYNNGYTDGYAIGYNEGENLGRRIGYNNGFISGKSEGLELSQSGSWTELMLAVTEAPINTFQSLFNFEILGLDMRAAFGAILTLCVVLIVIKKVVL